MFPGKEHSYGHVVAAATFRKEWVEKNALLNFEVVIPFQAETE